MDPGSSQMDVSQAMITLGVLQISITMMTVLQYIHADCRPTVAVLVVFPITRNNDMPRTIVILIEAALIATMKGEIEIATQMLEGMRRMPIEMILHRAGAYLSETIPPVGDRNMTIRPIRPQPCLRRDVQSNGTVRLQEIFLTAQLSYHQTRLKNWAYQETDASAYRMIMGIFEPSLIIRISEAQMLNLPLNSVVGATWKEQQWMNLSHITRNCAVTAHISTSH